MTNHTTHAIYTIPVYRYPASAKISALTVQFTKLQFELQNIHFQNLHKSKNSHRRLQRMAHQPGKLYPFNTGLYNTKYKY